MAGATIDDLARDAGGVVVEKKAYRRIAIGSRTLAYVNGSNFDFRSSDVTDAPKPARAKLTIKGNRVTLPISETKAAATLLTHVAGL